MSTSLEANLTETDNLCSAQDVGLRGTPAPPRHNDQLLSGKQSPVFPYTTAYSRSYRSLSLALYDTTGVGVLR